MTEIIDLDELVPDDLEFRYRGDTYKMPGDPPIETILELLKLFNRMSLADTNGNTDEQEQLATSAKEILLGLFQERNPKLKKLPFGVVGTQEVVRAMFERVGITNERPPTRTVPKTRKRAPVS